MIRGLGWSYCDERSRNAIFGIHSSPKKEFQPKPHNKHHIIKGAPLGRGHPQMLRLVWPPIQPPTSCIFRYDILCCFIVRECTRTTSPSERSEHVVPESDVLPSNSRFAGNIVLIQKAANFSKRHKWTTYCILTLSFDM